MNTQRHYESIMEMLYRCEETRSIPAAEVVACLRAACNALKANTEYAGADHRSRETLDSIQRMLVIGMPPVKGDQPAQAVGGNAEGEVPTPAPDCAPESPGSNSAAGAGEGDGTPLTTAAILRTGENQWVRADEMRQLERQLIAARKALKNVIDELVEMSMRRSSCAVECERLRKDKDEWLDRATSRENELCNLRHDFDRLKADAKHMKACFDASMRRVQEAEDELALAKIPTDVSAVEREEWRQERGRILASWHEAEQQRDHARNTVAFLRTYISELVTKANQHQ